MVHYDEYEFVLIAPAVLDFKLCDNWFLSNYKFEGFEPMLAICGFVSNFEIINEEEVLP